jgi:flagellar biosynthesis/type III secretory pathway chaperone
MSVQGLLQTMDKLIQIHLLMLELSEQKTNILVLNQVDKLNKIVNKETNLIKQIVQLDQQRIEDISEFLLQKGYKLNPKITVEDLIKLVVKAEEKKSLADKQRQLLGTIDKLRQLNQLNQKLVEQSLAFIEYSMDLFIQTPEQDAFYQNPHQQSSNPSRNGIFDTRA